VAQVRFCDRTGWTLQADIPKVYAALEHALACLGLAGQRGRVRLHSDLPRGRGYGSSTADIGAALSALGQAAGQPLAPAEIARLALRVEPTDSSIFPGLALWDHRHGQRFEALGSPPNLTVIVLDPGGEVDTIAYNQLDHRSTLKTLAPMHREAFQLLRDGLRHHNLDAIGLAATLSAKAHQIILSNPLLEPVIALAHEVGALGVCRAHSGTVIGLLLDPMRTEVGRVLARARTRFSPRVNVVCLALVSGGPRPFPLALASPTPLPAVMPHRDTQGLE
jgi:L-threonine kinase